MAPAQTISHTVSNTAATFAQSSPAIILLPNNDSGENQKQTIIFGIIGTLIGIVGLAITAIMLRLMYKSKKEVPAIEFTTLPPSTLHHVEPIPSPSNTIPQPILSDANRTATISSATSLISITSTKQLLHDTRRGG
ncbi:hypothetical protein B0J11DRAFT_580118 [Dendryphion nanum]|uniref:Uncharacterized protein n=1 Tax=Dendryphion nanum TaxID=256645 RepID=A0A9P9IM95_9PLEO|nr:hypothetical protein B0J11DRAFT_580118 [Dendryphion nanum]